MYIYEDRCFATFSYKRSHCAPSPIHATPGFPTRIGRPVRHWSRCVQVDVAGATQLCLGAGRWFSHGNWSTELFQQFGSCTTKVIFCTGTRVPFNETVHYYPKLITWHRHQSTTTSQRIQVIPQATHLQAARKCSNISTGTSSDLVEVGDLCVLRCYGLGHQWNSARH